MNRIELIQSKIHEIRGQKIMPDFDLAEMYQVETRVLNQAVKRNINRFPEDFMFRLSPDEWAGISSQFVMTSRGKRPKTALPLAFTEHGVVMLHYMIMLPIFGRLLRIVFNGIYKRGKIIVCTCFYGLFCLIF